MVMEASPTSSLKVPEPELLFEFLVVPLDAPAQLRERDEAVDFLGKLTGQDKKAVEWAESIPLGSTKELKSYH